MHPLLHKCDSGLIKDELTTEEALRVVDDAHELRTPLLIISGGEPLIREDITEVMRRLMSMA